MSGGVRHYSSAWNPINLSTVDPNPNRGWYTDNCGNIDIYSHKKDGDGSGPGTYANVVGLRTSINLSPFRYIRLRGMADWMSETSTEYRYMWGCYIRLYLFNTTGQRTRIKYIDLYYDGQTFTIKDTLINPTYTFDVSDINQQVFVGFQFYHYNYTALESNSVNNQGQIQSIEFLD